MLKNVFVFRSTLSVIVLFIQCKQDIGSTFPVLSQWNGHSFVPDALACSSGLLLLLSLNLFYTGRLYQCYMLEESVCDFRGVGSILSLLFYFWWKILLAKHCRPWSDTTLCGVWSGAAMFAYDPFMDFQVRMDQNYEWYGPLPYWFGYKTFFVCAFLPFQNNPKKSRSILQDGSRFMGLFNKEEKPCYSRIDTAYYI